MKVTDFGTSRKI